MAIIIQKSDQLLVTRTDAVLAALLDAVSVAVSRDLLRLPSFPTRLQPILHRQQMARCDQVASGMESVPAFIWALRDLCGESG
jgi:hypothetical protein